MIGPVENVMNMLPSFNVMAVEISLKFLAQAAIAVIGGNYLVNMLGKK
jgi:hypothetical protein